VPGSTTGPHIDEVIETGCSKTKRKNIFRLPPVDPRPPERIRISGQHGLFTKFEYLILKPALTGDDGSS
jgi:hypothetical protein